MKLIDNYEKAEKNYLHFKEDMRLKNELKITFKEKRRQFVKCLRHKQRKYTAQRLMILKHLTVLIQKSSGRKEPNLVRGKANKNIDSVIMDGGSVSSN